MLETLVAMIRGAGMSLIIGIDELDKMVDDHGAEEFFTRLKVLFPIPQCSFVLTVSTHAWSHFALRGLPVRDVFDSSLDAVVTVSPLRLRDSRRLLRRRYAGITDSQTLLCHLASGGLPRDLLRVARDLCNIVRGDEGLPNVRQLAHKVLQRDFETRLSGVRFWAATAFVNEPDAFSRFVLHLGELSQVMTHGHPDPVGTLKAFVRKDTVFARHCGLIHEDRVDLGVIADNESSLRALYSFCFYLLMVRRAIDALDEANAPAASVQTFADAFVEAKHLIEVDPAEAWRTIDQLCPANGQLTFFN
jgi:hypothetical protein